MPRKVNGMKSLTLMGGMAAVMLVGLSAKAELAGAIDAAVNALTPAERIALGTKLSLNDQTLFGGAISIRAYQAALFIAASQDGKAVVKKIVLQCPSPKTPPMGDILHAYYTQKGKTTYGLGLEGEHIVFGEQFRLHVFERAVLVWRKEDRVVQAAVLTKPFRPAK